MYKLIGNCLYYFGCCVIAGCISGCYYDKADIVYPLPGNCDTTLVKYSTTVVPILSGSCYVCHGGTASGGSGITLDNYTVLKNLATNGKLTGAISHASGFSPMPKNGAKLPECDILQIIAWVNAGALNN